MINVVWLVCGVGLVINIMVFKLHGIEALPDGILTFVPKVLEAFVALGIVTESRFSGLHTKAGEWKTFWKQLVLLLTIALTLRGVAIFIVGYNFGLPHAYLIATGLTATDPAAIGISLALVRVRKLESLFWLLTVESLLNDAEGLLAFDTANGAAFWNSLGTICLTLAMAGFLACTDTYLRLYVRGHWNKIEEKIPFLSHAGDEAKCEIAVACLVYIVASICGIVSGVSLIGMCAVGAIIADYLIHQIPHERDYTLDHLRDFWQERWVEVGLGTVLLLVMSLLPFHAIFANWHGILIAFAILAAILIARFIYDGCVAFVLRWRTKHEHEFKKTGVSIMASACLLGVPSIVGAHMYEQGLHLESTIVFATILFSWFTVFPTVFYIKWVDKSLDESTEQEPF